MASNELLIRPSYDDGRLRLTLLGELKLATVPTLENRLNRLRVLGRPVLLDLSELEYMDSAGLAVLIRVCRAARTNGWRFCVDPNIAPQPRRLLTKTNADPVALSA